MKRYIVDASVVIKALLKEDPEVEDKFTKLLEAAQKEKIEILSSRLLFVEVANGLRYEYKNKEKIKEVFDDFLSLPIRILNLTKNQVKEALNLSYELETTVYDTSYHVLAKANGATFLTCDKDYYKRAKSFGDIELLG